MQSPFPKDAKKLKAKLRRYERELRKEQKIHGGYISDGSGKRYLLGTMYLLLGDNAGAIKSFLWFDATFPGDGGEPGFWLSWTLALYRAGEIEAAAGKLRRAMLSNLYLIPHLLGEPQPKVDIRHRSNLEQADYLQFIPPELFALWDVEARQWAKAQYHGPELTVRRERFIQIEQQLKGLRSGPERTALIEESSCLRWED